MSKPKIVVVIVGGYIRDIISDTDVELLVVDRNIEGIDVSKIKNFRDSEGDEFRAHAYIDKPDVTDEVSEYFDQYHEC